MEREADPTINLAVLRGVASAPPDLRQLPSGRRLATLSIRTHGLTPPATSIPVAIWDPPAWVETIDTGEAVVAAGALRRRFYRSAGGGLGARVELEAATIGRAGDTRARRRARRLADEWLENLG